MSWIERTSFRPLLIFYLAVTIAIFAPSVNASDKSSSTYSLTSGLYTHHWNASEEHSKVWLVGIERLELDGKVSGLSYFKNSFNQPSLFVYPWGRVYRDLISASKFRLKWGAGILYGYVGEYEDKVPLNYKGFSPGLIVAGVWKLDKNRELQLNLLGTAGVMFSVNYGI